MALFDHFPFLAAFRARAIRSRTFKKRRDDARDESKTAAQIEDAVVRLEI
jgi:hypothetical protein